jgi:hypothetical protein
MSADFIAADEQAACKTLCSDVSSLIPASEVSQLPAKKRGMGAETLALTQLLMKASPQSRMQEASTISRAVAVIESMQRSSGKQYSQECTWQCSFDVREARERHVLAAVNATIDATESYSSSDVARQMGVDTCVDCLLRLLRSGQIEGKGKAQEALTGPVDVLHMISLLVSSVSRLSELPSPPLLEELIRNLATFIMLSR